MKYIFVVMTPWLFFRNKSIYDLLAQGLFPVVFVHADTDILEYLKNSDVNLPCKGSYVLT